MSPKTQLATGLLLVGKVTALAGVLMGFSTNLRILGGLILALGAVCVWSSVVLALIQLRVEKKLMLGLDNVV